jgi:hypothetical protein
MWQQGQVFKLKAKGVDGQPLWAYRYRLEGRGSARPQVDGYTWLATGNSALVAPPRYARCASAVRPRARRPAARHADCRDHRAADGCSRAEAGGAHARWARARACPTPSGCSDSRIGVGVP